MRTALVVSMLLTIVWPAGPAAAQAGAPGAPVAPPATRPAAGPMESVQPQPLDQVPPAKATAFRSLLHSAKSLTQSTREVPSRAGRLVVITQFADRLVPNNPQLHLLLSDIYQSQRNWNQAARSATIVYLAEPTDYMRGLRWMTQNTSLYQTAEQRVRLLGAIAEDPKLQPALRSEAAARMASILRRQGPTQEQNAISLFDRALVLDPYNPTALQGRFSFLPDPKLVDQVELTTKLLMARPVETRLALSLAQMLAARGLSQQAAEVYDYVGSIIERLGMDVPDDVILQHANALLDAGDAERVTQRFAPRLEKINRANDLRKLLIEAHRRLGQDDQAAVYIEQLAKDYQQYREAAQRSPLLARQLAELHLRYQRDAAAALTYANYAFRSAPKDPETLLLLGEAQLRNQQTEEGLTKLKSILGVSSEAAYYLADHYFSIGRAVDGEQALLSAAQRPRSGWAWRNIRRLAREHNVTLPEPDNLQRIATLYQTFKEGAMVLGAEPGKHLAVTLEPVRKAVRPGEPIEVKATVRNVGTQSVPTGPVGLLSPVMSLQVELADGDETFSAVPLLVWSTPRYLMPGQQDTQVVRLDVARLDQYLAMRPLDRIELTVRGVLDPFEDPRGKGRARSQLPSVTVEPVSIVRQSIYRDGKPANPADRPEAFWTTLSYIRLDANRGQLADRMRAVRQLASLFALSREVETRKVEAPKELGNRFSKRIFQAMLKETLDDPSPVVRAEILKSLLIARLDRGTVSLLAELVDDPDPMVRMRMAELIGTSLTPGRTSLLDHYRNDDSEWVQKMAEACRSRR